MTYKVVPKGSLVKRGKVTHQVIYPAIPDTHIGNEGKSRFDATQEPVGLLVNFHTHSQFGTESSVILCTTPEAEQSVAMVGDRRPGESRLTIAVPDKDGVEIPLMPLYGSEANTSVIVKDVCAEEITARIEKALKAEFGDAVKIQKSKSRPVADIRINMYDFVDNTPLAVNVLEAEAFQIAKGSYRTEYVTKKMLVGS